MKTIKHNGLEWMSQDVDKKMNWNDAINYCQSLGEGWRLPTIEELQSVVDYTKLAPATKIDVPIKSNWYWSSTTPVSNTGTAWRVNLGYGYVFDPKAVTGYVWPVRDIK